MIENMSYVKILIATRMKLFTYIKSHSLDAMQKNVSGGRSL